MWYRGKPSHPNSHSGNIIGQRVETVVGFDALFYLLSGIILASRERRKALPLDGKFNHKTYLTRLLKYILLIDCQLLQQKSWPSINNTLRCVEWFTLCKISAEVAVKENFPILRGPVMSGPFMLSMTIIRLIVS